MDSTHHARAVTEVLETQAGAGTVALLSDLADDGLLGRQTTLRITLFLAQLGLSIFSIAGLCESGRAEGLNGVEMAANRMGNSDVAKDAVCLAFVRSLLDNPDVPLRNDLQRMSDAGYRHDAILEVIAQVNLNLSLVNMVAAIEPGGVTSSIGIANTSAYPRLIAPSKPAGPPG